jgi:hypothetical protein
VAHVAMAAVPGPYTELIRPAHLSTFRSSVFEAIAAINSSAVTAAESSPDCSATSPAKKASVRQSIHPCCQLLNYCRAQPNHPLCSQPKTDKTSKPSVQPPVTPTSQPHLRPSIFTTVRVHNRSSNLSCNCQLPNRPSNQCHIRRIISTLADRD